MSNNATANVVSDCIAVMVNAVSDSEFDGNYASVVNGSGYSELDRGEKSRVRNAIQSRANSALRDGKFDSAKSMAELHNAFKNANSTNSVEIDPVDELRNVIRYSARVLSGMISGEFAPDGIDPVDLSDEFEFEFVANVTPEMENGEAVIFEFDSEMVTRFIPRRIRRNGKQHNVGEMIELAMAEFPENEFVRIAEIRNKIGELELANVDSSWDGRISARLFPNGEFTLSDSIVPMHSHSIGNGQTRNGAMRVS